MKDLAPLSLEIIVRQDEANNYSPFFLIDREIKGELDPYSEILSLVSDIDRTKSLRDRALAKDPAKYRPIIDKYEARIQEKTKRLGEVYDFAAAGGAGGLPPREPGFDESGLSRLRKKKASLERAIGIPIDVDTYTEGSLYALSLFDNDQIVETFRRAAREIKFSKGGLFSKNYLKGIVFRDVDDPPVAAYDRGSAILYLPAKVRAEFIINGGLYHEWHHPQMFEQYGREVAALERKFSRSRNNLLPFIDPAYEEVMINVRTFEFMGKSKDFVRHVYQKHAISEDVSGFEAAFLYTAGIISQLNEPNITADERNEHLTRYAEALGTFYHLDKHIYNRLRIELEENREDRYREGKKGYGPLKKGDYQIIKTLADTFIDTSPNNYILNLTKLFQQFGGK